MLNGHYCGNCKYWNDTKPTAKGRLPYYGTCSLGRPLKQGQLFNRTVGKGENKRIYKLRYSSFTIRTDKCKDWSKE